MKSGLASKLAAVGAGAAMLATMTAGLLATPAAAATGPDHKHKAKPAVFAGKPKVSLSDYDGECPVKVTFSGTIKVKATAGKTKVAYRWVRGNGSKSAVKTFTVGKGVKHVTVKETHKIGNDTKGWEALEVLSPRKAVSEKAHFKVSCDDDRKHVYKDAYTIHSTRRVQTKVWVDEGNCKALLVGRISTYGHRWVHYRWVVNGRVVDYGKVHVDGSTTVRHLIRTHDDLRGWAKLEVVGRYGSSDTAGFKIWCKDWHRPHKPGHPHKPDHQVKADVTHVGATQVARGCPNGVVKASGTIHSDGPGKVSYTWVVNGKVAGGGDVVFGHGGGSKSVHGEWSSYATKGGTVVLKIDGDSAADHYASVCSSVQDKTEDKAADKPAPASPEAPASSGAPAGA
ncbi:hypothetical protein ACFOWE_09040 [Planomonospora corallina]|uniref:Ig-like domain-containing protein n=1 Tax=Planomonospora corallina TaxID=1806052 RepID=A0ABV8I7L8_9ACTN